MNLYEKLKTEKRMIYALINKPTTNIVHNANLYQSKYNDGVIEYIRDSRNSSRYFIVDGGLLFMLKLYSQDTPEFQYYTHIHGSSDVVDINVKLYSCDPDYQFQMDLIHNTQNIIETITTELYRGVLSDTNLCLKICGDLDIDKRLEMYKTYMDTV